MEKPQMLSFGFHVRYYVLTYFHAKLMYCWLFRCRNGCQQTPCSPVPRLIWHHYGEVQSHMSSWDLSVSMLWSPSMLWLGTKYMWEEARLVIYRLRSWSVKSSFTSDSSYLALFLLRENLWEDPVFLVLWLGYGLWLHFLWKCLHSRSQIPIYSPREDVAANFTSLYMV